MGSKHCPHREVLFCCGSSNLSMSSEENLLVLSNGKDSVVAFETRTGRRHWRFSVKGGAEGPIVLKEGRVYFGGRDGVFYVLSLDSGKAVWTYPTDSTFISSPWVSKSRVYFQTSLGDVYSLNKKQEEKFGKGLTNLMEGFPLKAWQGLTFIRVRYLWVLEMVGLKLFELLMEN